MALNTRPAFNRGPVFLAGVSITSVWCLDHYTICDTSYYMYRSSRVQVFIVLLASFTVKRNENFTRCIVYTIFSTQNYILYKISALKLHKDFKENDQFFKFIRHVSTELLSSSVE